MKFSQTYPADYLGRQTTTALDDKVIIHYKNIFSEFTTEYPYSEFKTKVVTGKQGDTAWTSLGWSFIILGILIQLADILLLSLIALNTIRWIFFVLLIPSAISFTMRFIKYETVGFYGKEGEYLFEIKIPRREKKEAQNLIIFIKERINLQNPKGKT